MTAVEKIIEEINNELQTLEGLHGKEIFGRKVGLAFAKRVAEQAKEMEKEQIVKAVDSVQIVCREYLENGWTREDILGKEVPTSEDKTYFGLSKTGKQYYNETFKSE